MSTSTAGHPRLEQLAIGVAVPGDDVDHAAGRHGHRAHAHAADQPAQPRLPPLTHPPGPPGAVCEKGTVWTSVDAAGAAHLRALVEQLG
ncbi:hypothetical protein [Modestobacter sp. DSM 44400]|uniref:hypothetical protein n=1 Tax=Modestobacter sp. DSM 44400 TaxID=1550230 RepID=UPI0020C85233|nr:hypothetical protein [Modestobacter sp. DSM 44400]